MEVLLICDDNIEITREFWASGSVGFQIRKPGAAGVLWLRVANLMLCLQNAFALQGGDAQKCVGFAAPANLRNEQGDAEMRMTPAWWGTLTEPPPARGDTHGAPACVTEPPPAWWGGLMERGHSPWSFHAYIYIYDSFQ